MSAPSTIRGIEPLFPFTLSPVTPDPRTRAREFLNRMAAMADYYDARVSKAAEDMRKLRDFYEHREWTKPWHTEIDVTPVWIKPQHFELWNFETKSGECTVWSQSQKGGNTRRQLPRSDKKTSGRTPIRGCFVPHGTHRGTLDDEIEYGEMILLGDTRPTIIITESEYFGGLDDEKRSRPYEDCLDGEYFPSSYFGGLRKWIKSQDKTADGELHPEEQKEKIKSETMPFVRQSARRIDEEDWDGFQIRDFTSKDSPETAEKAEKKKTDAKAVVVKIRTQKRFGMYNEEKFKEDAITYVVRTEGMTHEEAGMLLDKNADAARQQLDERRKKFLAEPSGPLGWLAMMKEILWKTARNDTPPGWYVLAQMPSQPYKLYPIHVDDLLEAFFSAPSAERDADFPVLFPFLVSRHAADREAYRVAKSRIEKFGRSKVSISETYQTVREAFSAGYIVSPDEWDDLHPRLTGPKPIVEGRCDEG